MCVQNYLFQFEIKLLKAAKCIPSCALAQVKKCIISFRRGVLLPPPVGRSVGFERRSRGERDEEDHRYDNKALTHVLLRILNALFHPHTGRQR